MVDDYELTSGSPVEIFDTENSEWVRTRIEHKNGYYAECFGPNINIDGMKARVRK